MLCKFADISIAYEECLSLNNPAAKGLGGMRGFLTEYGRLESSRSVFEFIRDKNIYLIG